MMRPAAKLYTLRRELELLFDEEDRPRAGAKRVTVTREALKHVLMDHANLIQAVARTGTVVEGIDK